jgi:hypothetical protein
VREKRNFLAHHFWFDRAHLMFRAEDIRNSLKNSTATQRSSAGWMMRQRRGFTRDKMNLVLQMTFFRPQSR